MTNKQREALLEMMARAIARDDGCEPDKHTKEGSPNWYLYIGNAKAALGALSSPGSPVWLAPVTPTLPMVRAGFDALKKLPTSFPDHYAEDCYAAMRQAHHGE